MQLLRKKANMKKHKHVLKNCTSKIYKKKQYNGYKKRTAKNMQKHQQITEKPGLAAGRYKEMRLEVKQSQFRPRNS